MGSNTVYARSPSPLQRAAPTTITPRSPFPLCSCSTSLSKMGTRAAPRGRRPPEGSGAYPTAKTLFDHFTFAMTSTQLLRHKFVNDGTWTLVLRFKIDFSRSTLLLDPQWLNVVPCKNLGLKLDDQQLRISIGLCLGANICVADMFTVVKELNGTVYTVFLAPRVVVASQVMLQSILS